MIGYGRGKFILKLPPFFNYERGTSRAGKFKTSNENKQTKNVFVIVFI